MYYEEDVLAEVRMGNDIVDVIGEYVKLKRSGANWFGLCPFHNEKTPSFSVNSDKQIFRCFGCGAAGNVFGFIEKQENLSFPEAVQFLARRINYQLPENRSKSDDYKRGIREQLWEIHKVAARFYYDCLNDEIGAQARAYLDKRAVAPAIRKKFGLGYSPDSWQSLYKHLTDSGFEHDMIMKSGLINSKNERFYDKFRNRLMFPIIDVYGHIIGFGGRQLRDNKEEAKYLNSPDTEIFNKSYNPYNLNFARLANKRDFILVEGYMDVISLYQAGFKNVVAALGTAFNQNHASVLKRYTKSIIVLFDSDSAGENAVLRALPVLREAGISAKVLQVKDAKDPDEYIKSYGAEAFAKLLTTAVNGTIFRVEHEKKKYSPNDIDDRVALLNEVVKILSEVDNPLELELYVRDLASELDVTRESLLNEVQRVRGTVDSRQRKQKNKSEEPKNIRTSHMDNALEDAKSGIINIIAADKSLFERVERIFDKSEFDDELYEKLYDIIKRLHTQNIPIQEAEIMTALNEESDTVKSEAARIFILQGSFDSNERRERALIDNLRLVKLSYIDTMLDNANNDEEIMSLLRRKKDMENIIKSL